MAREKQQAVQRTPSQLLAQSNGIILENGHATNSSMSAKTDTPKPGKVTKHKPAEAGFWTLAICVGGIYASL
jgi:hypothetical protein